MTTLEIAIPITTVLASLLALWLLVLSWVVIKARRSTGISLGDGEDRRLQRAIRAQANLTEYAPLFTLLIALAELQSDNPVVVATLAAVFLIGRFAHGYAFAFTEKSVIGRIGGMALTLGAIALAAIYNLALVLM